MLERFASFLKFTNGDSDLYDTSLQVYPKHLNAAIHGGNGIQHLVDIAIRSHQHVDYALLIEKFPSFATSNFQYAFYKPLMTNTPINGDDNYSYSLTFSQNNSTYNNFAALTLDWISGGVYGIGYPLTQDDYTIKGFTWDSLDTKTFNYGGTDNAPGYTDNDYWDALGRDYGFSWWTSNGPRYVLFANPVPPIGVNISGLDVNSLNLTLADHLSDQSIHKRSTTSLTGIPQYDHMAGIGGYLNIYDLPDKVIEYNQYSTRKDDEYPLNAFEGSEEYEDLDSIGHTTENSVIDNDIAHPILYEEAYYMYHGKIKQYKLLKADPDDFKLSKMRQQSLPMDSLFVGGGVLTDDTGAVVQTGVSSVYYNQRYIMSVNQALDTYFYNNFYYKHYNAEYSIANPFDFISLLWTNGLGYQPMRGISTGGI